jgi:hypothetical protein
LPSRDFSSHPSVTVMQPIDPMPDPIDREPGDPTPEQIRQRAAEVRRGWSARVVQRRQTWVTPIWSPPLVLTVELLREMNSREE